ncbi:hypothetical protein DFH27DRAFT_528225 [Peziza echinospora]|nr:hypothetical protein DFH27DRAFT_528225 [Peziza echinospora]
MRRYTAGRRLRGRRGLLLLTTTTTTTTASTSTTSTTTTSTPTTTTTTATATASAITHPRSRIRSSQNGLPLGGGICWGGQGQGQRLVIQSRRWIGDYNGRPPLHRAGPAKSTRFARNGERYWDEPEDFIVEKEGRREKEQELEQLPPQEHEQDQGGHDGNFGPSRLDFDLNSGQNRGDDSRGQDARRGSGGGGKHKSRFQETDREAKAARAQKYKVYKPGYDLTSIKLTPSIPAEESMALDGKPLSPELRDLVRKSIRSFQQQVYQADVVTEESLHREDILVNHPSLKHNSDLWRMLFLFRRRVDGDAGVIEVFRGTRMRGVDIPTDPADPNTDIIWNLLYDSALRLPLGPFYNELFGYVRYLRKPSGRRWAGTYTKIITHMLVHSPATMLKHHEELIEQGNHPAEGWPRFFVNFARKALALPADRKRASLTRLRQLYTKVPVVAGIYDQLIPFLGANATISETYKWHKLCLGRGDAPRYSSAADSIFEYRGLAGSMEEIRALIDNLEERGVEITEESLCVLVRNRELKEDVLLFFLKRLIAGTMLPRPFGDKFWATVLKAKDLKVKTMIAFMGQVGITTLGPEPVRALIGRLEGNEAAVELYVGELRNAGIAVSDLLLHTAWAEHAEKELAKTIKSDTPMGYDARHYYDEKILGYIRKHNIRHALHVLIEMRAFSVPIKPTTLQFLLRVILRPRKAGHTPQTTPIHFVGKDDLGFAIQVMMGCVRAGMYVPPFFWKEPMKRMGMELRLDDLARLAGWLVEWYHPARGGMMVRRYGTHHIISEDAARQSNQLGYETGGARSLDSLPDGIEDYGYTRQFDDEINKTPSSNSRIQTPKPTPPQVAATRSRLPFDDPEDPLPPLPATILPPTDPDYGVPQTKQSTESASESPYPVTHPFYYMPPTIRASHKHNPLRQLFPSAFIRAIVEWGFFGIYRRPGTLPLPEIDIGPAPAPSSLKITLAPKLPAPLAGASGLHGTDAPHVPYGNTDITWGIRLASYLNNAGVHVDKRIVSRAILVRLRAIYGTEKPMHLRSALNRRVREVVTARYFNGVEEVANLCQDAWSRGGPGSIGGRRLIDSRLVAQWTKTPGHMHIIRRRLSRGKWEDEGAGRRLTTNEWKRIGRLRRVEEQRRLATAPGSIASGTATTTGEERSSFSSFSPTSAGRKNARESKPYPIYYHQNSVAATRPRTREWASSKPRRIPRPREIIAEETYGEARSWATYEPSSAGYPPQQYPQQQYQQQPQQFDQSQTQHYQDLNHNQYPPPQQQPHHQQPPPSPPPPHHHQDRNINHNQQQPGPIPNRGDFGHGYGRGGVGGGVGGDDYDDDFDDDGGGGSYGTY